MSEPATTATPAWFVPTLVLTALAGVVWRGVYVIVFVRDHVDLVGDALTYHLLAGLLADGDGYIRPLDFIAFGREIPTAEFPPLWPAVLAAADLAGLDSPTSQRLVGVALGGCSVVLVGLLAKAVAGPRAGIAAAVLAAVSPQLLTLDGALLAEALYVPLVAAALLLTAMLLARGEAPDTGSILLALGAVVGLAALTRSEAVVLAVALILPAVVLATPRRAPFPAASLAIALAPVVLLVGLWTARNAVRLDAVVPLTNNSATLVAGANCDQVYRGREVGLWNLECAIAAVPVSPADERAIASAMRSSAIEYSRANAERVPAVVAARVLRTFGLWDVPGQLRYESLEGRPYRWLWAGWVGHVTLAALAVVGAVALHRQGRRQWFLLVPLGIVAVTAAFSYGNQRFRALAEPSLLVLAGAGVAALLPRQPVSGTPRAGRRSAGPVATHPRTTAPSVAGPPR
jgi:4-amino-4-deoxy-L-arabinose transferase-like glycosyltransferase